MKLLAVESIQYGRVLLNPAHITAIKPYKVNSEGREGSTIMMVDGQFYDCLNEPSALEVWWKVAYTLSTGEAMLSEFYTIMQGMKK